MESRSNSMQLTADRNPRWEGGFQTIGSPWSMVGRLAIAAASAASFLLRRTYGFTFASQRRRHRKSQPAKTPFKGAIINSYNRSEQGAGARRGAHRERAPERNPQSAGRDLGAARSRRQRPESSQRQERRRRDGVKETCLRDQGCHNQRQGRPKHETRGRRQRGLDRAGFERRRDSEFVTRVRAERVMGHELVGDRLCERGIEAAVDVDRRQFRVFAFVVRSKLRSFEVGRQFGLRHRLLIDRALATKARHLARGGADQREGRAAERPSSLSRPATWPGDRVRRMRAAPDPTSLDPFLVGME